MTDTQLTGFIVLLTMLTTGARADISPKAHQIDICKLEAENNVPPKYQPIGQTRADYTRRCMQAMGYAFEISPRSCVVSAYAPPAEYQEGCYGNSATPSPVQNMLNSIFRPGESK